MKERNITEEQEKETDNTEEKIRSVAKKLFTEKGYARTTIREVAEEAGVNIALLNYYFRSKEKLFKAIFMENFKEYSGEIYNILHLDELTLEERVTRYINELTEQLSKNPELPMFIISECRQNPEVFESKTKMFQERLSSSKLVIQLQEEEDKGNIRKVDPKHLHFMISSLIIAPFLHAPLIKASGIQGEKWDEFLEDHKNNATKMVLSFLKSKD